MLINANKCCNLRIENPCVAGSIPARATILKNPLYAGFLLSVI